jgi:hypothetical protein
VGEGGSGSAVEEVEGADDSIKDGGLVAAVVCGRVGGGRGVGREREGEQAGEGGSRLPPQSWP